jgi:hypothetical protein
MPVRLLARYLWLLRRRLVMVVVFASVAIAMLLYAHATTPAPPAGGMFETLAPGSALPSDADCAARVQRDPWEPRPENAAANHNALLRDPSTSNWSSSEADQLRARVTGNFSGTTDEIIQWASCKWGFAAEITRAQAVAETNWVQSAVGDSGVSYGLLQIKSTVWKNTLPASRDSTAYNVDWSLGLRRACFEGYVYGDAARGDLWGCIGAHYSGEFGDAEGKAYTDGVKGYMQSRPWLSWPSPAGGQPPTIGRVSPNPNPTPPPTPDPIPTPPSPNPSPTPNPGTVKADINGDGKVNITDLSLLLSDFGKSGISLKGDLNQDQKVTITDLSLLLSKWSP